MNIKGMGVAREAVATAVTAAERNGRLNAEEAAELRNQLELEINLEFGTRHEDAALKAYENRVAQQVYGDQYRVKVAMPCGGPAEALARVFPPEGWGSRSKLEAAATAGRGTYDEVDQPYFYLTGFTDGIVDLPRSIIDAPTNLVGGLDTSTANETLIVEVKHRMGKIKDPPNIYDVVQLCSYCLVLGCSRGDLVQCLRDAPGVDAGGHSADAAANVGTLRVTRLDFSEGSNDRIGWDQHVLPKMYEVARAVYAARADQAVRLRLLSASPEERPRIVGCLCPHLAK
jgi:hypothetical protein